jgi:hypothetical protein
LPYCGNFPRCPLTLTLTLTPLQLN